MSFSQIKHFARLMKEGFDDGSLQWETDDLRLQMFEGTLPVGVNNISQAQLVGEPIPATGRIISGRDALMDEFAFDDVPEGHKVIGALLFRKTDGRLFGGFIIRRPCVSLRGDRIEFKFATSGVGSVFILTRNQLQKQRSISGDPPVFDNSETRLETMVYLDADSAIHSGQLDMMKEDLMASLVVEGFRPEGLKNIRDVDPSLLAGSAPITGKRIEGRSLMADPVEIHMPRCRTVGVLIHRASDGFLVGFLAANPADHAPGSIVKMHWKEGVIVEQMPATQCVTDGTESF